MKMAPEAGPFFQRWKIPGDRRLLICSDLGCRGIERKAAIDMTDDNGDSHQHDGSGDAAQDEADKS